ncbi:MAG: PspA/IM30 family protein [Deltaproteobacteria bacterium]|nr:PspA/IM30 family protein [Deltaproteobacteria bacterium]
MGIIGRLAQLIKSNLNDLISKSEDPEKMLNQVILEMNGQLTDAKKQVALAIGDEKRLGKQYEASKASADEWERKAMMAVRAGDDELAKEALQRHREDESIAQEYRSQWEKQRESVNKLRGSLQQLNSKIEEAKRKKNVLNARFKRAQAQKAIQETIAGLNDNSAFDTMNRMEEKIVAAEAEADAMSEVAEHHTGDLLAQKFKDLENNRGADMALAELKAKMGVQPAEAAAPQAGVRIETSAPAAVRTDDGAEELEQVLAAAEARRQNQR